MKKLTMLAVMLIAATLICPAVHADDAATLEVRVTFDQPIRIWYEPLMLNGQFEVIEGDTLTFKVITEEKGNPDLHLEVVEQPLYSRFIPYEIDPTNPCRREGRFLWTPEYGQAQDEPYKIVFRAFNDNGEEAILTIEVKVIEAEISIELNNASWVLDEVVLGSMRSNDLNGDGVGDNVVTNAGNVSIALDIGYGPRIPEGLQRGKEPGPDTYATLVRIGEGLIVPILPNDSRVIAKGLEPREQCPLNLTYAAPTEITLADILNMSDNYEIRAYKYWIVEPPIEF